MLFLGAMVLLLGGAYLTDLIKDRRDRRIGRSLSRMEPGFKGRRHPELDLEIAHLFGYSNVVWVMCRGTDAARLPPYLSFKHIARCEAELGPSLSGWLRTLNAEVSAIALADGWVASVGFESVERVGRDYWPYFK